MWRGAGTPEAPAWGLSQRDPPPTVPANAPAPGHFMKLALCWARQAHSLAARPSQQRPGTACAAACMALS